MIHLDTHVVAWLYHMQVNRLPDAVLRRIEDYAPVISPMVYLELQYLHEIGRGKASADQVLADMVSRIQLRISDAPWAAVVAHSGAMTWTRDPFDRLICANADLDGFPLLTADRVLQEHFAGAVWD